MKPIFMVIGPPAVGKSTTSRALAAQFNTSIHIPVDDLRHMVVSGLVLPGSDWGADLIQQVYLARTTVTQMALTYHNAGFVVVIDDFWDVYHRNDYQELFSHPAVHRVILYPAQEEAHRRNLIRTGDRPERAYIDGGIQDVYQSLRSALPELAQDGWLVLDTTALSVEESVREIIRSTIAADQSE